MATVTKRRQKHAIVYRLAPALLAVALASSASAQGYPARRITILVPFSPATAFDLIARTAGQKISERYGQPVVVDNKPGASGTLGSEMVAAAAPDGYTMVTAGAPLTVHKALIKDLRYDPLTSFTPIATVAASSVGLVINPAVMPVNSLGELIAAIRAKPGFYNYSSPGAGNAAAAGLRAVQAATGTRRAARALSRGVAGHHRFRVGAGTSHLPPDQLGAAARAGGEIAHPRQCRQQALAVRSR